MSGEPGMASTQIEALLKQKKIVTPSYIWDTDVLRAHVENMKNIVCDTAGLCYAMKANPFLITEFKDMVDKIEVCSPGELQICMKHKIPGSKIIFSGVNKTKEDVEAAFEYGVAVMTIESRKHFLLIREYCEKHKVQADVYLRLTSGSQFGMDAKEIEKNIAERENYQYIHICGIHFFSGTQKKKTDKHKQELDELDAFMLKQQKEYGLSNLTLEYGAGLAAPYFEGEDFDRPYKDLEELAEYIKQKNASYRPVLELGRFFAYSCGVYLTKVEEVKCNKGHSYVLVDGGIHQLNYYGQNMAMRIPKMELLSDNESGGTQECTICGSLCTVADVLVRKWSGPLPKEGDVFAFYNAGSYSVTEAPALFLSRKLPAVYRYGEENKIEVLRTQDESYVHNLGIGE